MQATHRFDLLVAGGTLLDPASGRHQQLDVGVADGRIVALERGLARDQAARVLDVADDYVTPGLIDFHVHSYWGVNPYGADLDLTCQATGVTTAVDAGSSGPVNFAGFQRFIAGQSRTRMLAFVCLAQHGVLHAPGELVDIGFADPEGAARTVREHPDVAVGIKLRLRRTNVGANGREALRLALEAAAAAGRPLMVHIGDSPMSMDEIAAALRPGDVITHCYTPLPDGIVDERGRPRRSVVEAHQRGVLLDVGHARGHFTFEIARACLAEGLAPDVISTDLHARGGAELIVDLPTTMTKFLALGLRLEQVVGACTINPARAIGWDDRLGRLEVGREADLAVLGLLAEPTRLRDSRGAEVLVDQRLAARWTIRRGEVVPSAS
jgi:dihydroorotase